MSKEQNIVEGNKLIHEFMKVSWMYPMEYHSSWGLLMPVVEKIKTVSDMGTLGNTIAYLMSRTKNTYTAMDSIEDLWLAIVKFIQWYNNQQKQVKE